jgi:putative ABC transport system substrate-binding protein
MLGGMLPVARALRAQQKATPVIGYLSLTSPGPFSSSLAAFRRGLSETGYVEGKNVTIEYRWAEGRYDQLPLLAADLVGRQVDVIVTGGGTAPARAAKNATSTIPIVFAGGDPVADGVVASLAHPGGNVTGMTFMVGKLIPKQLELLSNPVPEARVIALLVNLNDPNVERSVTDVLEAARAKHLQLPVLEASNESEIDAAFASLGPLHAEAVLIAGDLYFFSRREQLVAQAI